MTPSNLDRLADEYEEPILKIDGFDDCALGVATRAGSWPTLVYSRTKMIHQLTNAMPIDDAEEFFDFNIGQAYMGEMTPLILED
tara:strand:- start:2160 stop:2411 length:252 start_codon:yes stop_codon:yes gene_type:complete